MLERTTMGKVVLKQGKRSLFNLKEFLSSLATIIRSSLIGFFLGILPGAGATVASALAYTTERKMAGEKGNLVKVTCVV